MFWYVSCFKGGSLKIPQLVLKLRSSQARQALLVYKGLSVGKRGKTDEGKRATPPNRKSEMTFR